MYAQLKWAQWLDVSQSHSHVTKELGNMDKNFLTKSFWLNPTVLTFRDVTICFNNDTVLNDTWLVMRYKNNMGSFKAIRSDTIQWLEIEIVTCFLLQIEEK